MRAALLTLVAVCASMNALAAPKEVKPLPSEKWPEARWGAEAEIGRWHWTYNRQAQTPVTREKYEREIFCTQIERLLFIEWLKIAKVDPLLKLKILEGMDKAEELLCSNVS